MCSRLYFATWEMPKKIADSTPGNDTSYINTYILFYRIPTLMNFASVTEPRPNSEITPWTDGHVAGIHICEPPGYTSIFYTFLDLITRGIHFLVIDHGKKIISLPPKMWVSRSSVLGLGLLRTNRTYHFPQEATHNAQWSWWDQSPKTELMLMFKVLS